MLRRITPPPPDPSAPPAAPRRLRVFAVDVDAVQLDWAALGPGAVTVRAGGDVVHVDADGGPGTVWLGGLPPGSLIEVTVTGAGIDDAIVLPTRTLSPPPGDELTRLAAITDLHLGTRRFGKAGTIVERPTPSVLHPTRCARAAVDELEAWGARTVVAKGDLTDSSRPQHWAQFAELAAQVEATGADLLIAPGNHETHRKNTVEPVQEAARHGITIRREDVAVTDVPGLRIVTMDTTIEETDVGRVAHLADDVGQALREAEGPAMLVLHHHLQRWRWPWHPPPGVPGPEARAFLGVVRRANPNTIVTSGHTHRHRRRSHGPLTVVETGSTKDYPGTWAGYRVHEGGITQVVRRTAEPSCVRWTEWSGRAAFGMWRHWSPGTLDDRCFALTWGARPGPVVTS